MRIGTRCATRIGSPSDAAGPPALPGLVLWFRADRGITLNGADVSGWADQSQTANNASQITAIDQPRYIASDTDGLPSVEFDHTNTESMTYAHNTVYAGNAWTKSFWINQPAVADLAAGYRYWSQHSGSSTTSRFWFNYVPNAGTKLFGFTHFGTAGNYSQTFDWTARLGTWVHVALAWDGSLGTPLARMKFYINGVSQTLAGTPLTSALAATGSTATCRISGGNLGAQPFTGRIDDIVEFNRQLTPEEVLQIYNYRTRV